MNDILIIKNLTKQFKGEKKPSIENINFNLKSGRCLGVVGGLWYHKLWCGNV